MPSAFFERLKRWLSGQKTLPKAQEARAVFAQEHADIATDFEELLRSYRTALAELDKARARLPDEDLLRHATEIEDTYHALRRALRRASVAAMPTQVLMDEWREWDHFQERSDEALHPLQDERREMLRSELVLRGALLDRQKALPEPKPVAVPSPAMHEEETVFEAELSPSVMAWEPVRSFEAWDEHLLPTFADAATAWDGVFASWEGEDGDDHARLAEYAAARREAHALKKQFRHLVSTV